MLAWANPIYAAIRALVGGLIGPATDIWKNHQNVELEKYKTATGYDLDAYKAECAFVLQANAQKVVANNWWGPKFLYMMVGFGACLHTLLVFLDTSFTFLTGHYGVLGIPSLPHDYFVYEKQIVGSLFIVSVVERGAPALAAIVRR